MCGFASILMWLFFPEDLLVQSIDPKQIFFFRRDIYMKGDIAGHNTWPFKAGHTQKRIEKEEGGISYIYLFFTTFIYINKEKRRREEEGKWQPNEGPLFMVKWCNQQKKKKRGASADAIGQKLLLLLLRQSNTIWRRRLSRPHIYHTRLDLKGETPQIFKSFWSVAVFYFSHPVTLPPTPATVSHWSVLLLLLLLQLLPQTGGPVQSPPPVLCCSHHRDLNHKRRMERLMRAIETDKKVIIISSLPGHSIRLHSSHNQPPKKKNELPNLFFFFPFRRRFGKDDQNGHNGRCLRISLLRTCNLRQVPIRDIVKLLK